MMLTKLAICYVIFNGDPIVLEHELAHCWGWVHTEPVATSTIHQHPRPPSKFRKPYPNVIIYERYGKDVAKNCAVLSGLEYNTPYLMTVKGCSYGGMQ